jgi:hypothetical protein
MFVSAKMAVKTGIVRDERYLEHKPGHMHPEYPNHLKAVYKKKYPSWRNSPRQEAESC